MGDPIAYGAVGLWAVFVVYLFMYLYWLGGRPTEALRSFVSGLGATTRPRGPGE